MRLEIEISDDSLETFKELVEDTEMSVTDYVGRAVDGLAALAAGDFPAYAFVELLADPSEYEEEEEEEPAEAGAAL